MRRLLPLLLFACGIARADSAIHELVAESPVASNVLFKAYIYVGTTGGVDVAFEEMLQNLQRTNLLQLVQDAYARTLPEGEKVKFVVKQTSSNTYAYTNEKDQPSVVTEVHRGVDTNGSLHAVFHVAGERFIGAFQSLIHVKASPVGTDPPRSVYAVQVYAYPENAVWRFVIRHLGVIERYFRDKTAHIQQIASRVCKGLCAETADTRAASSE